jgi:DNA modification methylase
MTVYVDDVVAWLQGREWLVLNGYLPRYHAVLCDPPYFLGSITKRFGKPGSAPARYGTDGAFQRQSRGFMGQTWDGFDSPWHYQDWCTEWARLLLSFVYPGAVLLAFGGTRTYHRLAAGLEDAGWEVGDSLVWMYGSGFPKSHDISKALDRERRRDYVQAAVSLGLTLPDNSHWDWTAGEHSPSDKWWERFKAVLSPSQWRAIEREVIGRGTSGKTAIWAEGGMGDYPITAPATPLAARWSGYGTALKPAYEPVLLARAPRNGHTYAALAREFGTGAINVDGGRIQFANNEPYSIDERCRPNTRGTKRKPSVVDYVHEIAAVNVSHLGRWPANLILGCACAGAEHDADCPVRLLGEQSGERDGGGAIVDPPSTSALFGGHGRPSRPAMADSGTAARFFFKAKAAAWEREAGLTTRSHHPTMKPIALTEYLARLLLPPPLQEPRRLLIPFAGSGSEMIGAQLAGWDVVDGIEQSADYAAIARARLAWWGQFRSYEQAQSAAGADAREAAEREAERKLGIQQLDLFDGETGTW